MNEAITLDRLLVNDNLTKGIRLLQEATGMTYKAIGITIGYKTGETVKQIMARDDVLPGPLHLACLSSLLSLYDIDFVSDLFSADGKRTLPVPTSFEGLLDGCILNEVADNAVAVGHAIPAWHGGDLDDAELWGRKALGALYRFLAEIARRRARPWSPPHGDGAIQPVMLTLT